MLDFSALIKTLQTAFPALELREREPMSAHTSFRIGGPARLMAVPATEEEAIGAAAAAKKLGIPVIWMGNGSNLLVSDDGVAALVIKTAERMNQISLSGEGELTAGSGVLLSRLAVFACEHGLTGLEFAHGIPGTLGGAVTMNAGAYDGEMSQVLRSVRHVSEDGTVEELPAEKLKLGYRTSIYSDGKRLILLAKLALKPGNRDTIRAKMDELRERRTSKQPLEYPSAGSMFKRPPGHFAGALIDQCGLRGFTVGGAQVSEKHAGFVINRGGATCRDVLELVQAVQRTVEERTGVRLEMEVKTLGL
ncbi:MAG: UDP-N-acetylmuramate dehydrogenase [Oscillospiraceae bacterium]|nr:UDP-N-acetylmuramate dehydrogenase [Oscillospiraceae bacterium]